MYKWFAPLLSQDAGYSHEIISERVRLLPLDNPLPLIPAITDIIEILLSQDPPDLLKGEHDRKARLEQGNSQNHRHSLIGEVDRLIRILIEIPFRSCWAGIDTAQIMNRASPVGADLCDDILDSGHESPGEYPSHALSMTLEEVQVAW